MACIITFKGEEIPYEDWVQRLENGLLDELINDGSIDISEFKGEIKPTPIEKKEEVKQEELAPQKPKQPTTQPEVKAKLIELGLTEEEAETSSRIYDVYVKNEAAKTGRSVEDVYGDIEFKGEGESGGLNQIIGEKGMNNLEEISKVVSDLAIAKEMDLNKKSSQEIWDKTGWEKGKDGKWRTELSPTELNKDFELDVKRVQAHILSSPTTNYVSFPIDTIVNMETLNNVYPDLKGKITVDFLSMPKGDMGALHILPNGKFVIKVNINEFIKDGKFNKQKFRRTIIHEIQHTIQTLEGFTNGSSPTTEAKNIENDISQINRLLEKGDIGWIEKAKLLAKKFKISRESPYKRYLRNAGEVEARNATYRSDLNEEERKGLRLEQTEDISRKKQIIELTENGLNQLAQNFKSTAKGRITFTDLKSIMSIFKNGDASTFVHELSHHDLQGYIDEARKGNEQARQAIREVVKSTYPKLSESEINKKLEEVLKIPRTQENVRGTEYEKIQEHYARGFEKWLKDGDKAGFSAEMVALFEKMKEFLTRIYEAIKLSPIEVQVSPQVEQMYKDMFGIEYFGITEQLEELRNDIQQDNIENVGDVSMDDLLDGLLQRGLQQDPKPRLTVEESLIKMAEIMFKNFETDEINVINDIKAKINGLQTTEERKQEILAYLTPKMEERLKEEVAFANTNLRQLALKIIQSESSTDKDKKQARKNAYYEKMDLQKERDKAEKRAGKNITELENDTNKLVKSVSKDNNVGAELVNDLVSTFQRVNAQYESAKARGDKDMIEKTEAMASDLLDALFNQSTTAGKTLAAQKVLKFVIPDMYVKWIEKKVNLRNSETAVKDLKEKLKEALKNMRALEANESWALQVQDKLEKKIESLHDLIAQQNQDIERLKKLKAEVEAEEKKPQERATTEPNLNKKGIIEQAKGSEYVNKLREEMLKRAKERGLMQDINEMPDSLLLTELATEYIIDQIKNGKKVSVQKLYNFLKDVHFSDTKIDDILSTYQSIKESLKGETSVNNFSTQTEIDEYRDKLLQVKELNGKIREKEMSQDQLEILEYEKILARVNKLKKKISDNDLEMKITPKVNSERIFFLKKEEAKLKKELDDLRKEAKVANWSEEEVIRKRIEKDYDLTEKSEIKAIKDKQKEIDRIDIKLANLEEKSEEKRILAEYKARVEEELSKQKISEAAQNVLADNQKVKTPKAPVVLYRPTQGNQITLAEVDKLNKEKGGNVDVDDLRREFRLGYIGAQELMNAYNKILVQRENNKVRKFVDENYGRVVTKKLDDGTIVETREKFTDEEFEALIETPISNNRTLFDVIQIQMDRQATIKAFEKEQKRKEEAIKQAPLSVAKRIIGEAERRNALRTPKEQDAIKKLKEILFKRAVDKFKEKPFKERVEKSIEEKLADFLNEELLANGKDWDVEIKKEIDSMIDNAKYSDEDKAMMREFISDYLADRTETLLTNAVADDVLKKVLSEGYPTKDGKVDWHTIIKKNYKNQEGARQYLVEKLGERIGSEKLANDVIEALEKRFQKQVSQRKEKYLEAEIRRLEKLKENEKLPQRVNSRIKKLIELDNIGGLDEDIFYSYMAKELGMDALTPEDLNVVKKFITLIQSTPEGEEKNNLMRTLSAFISMRVSPKAFTIKSMVEFKLSNMLAHPITSLVNATAGFSQPIMMFKRFLTTGDTNYLKIYFDSFNKGVFKAAFQSGYLKSGMNYESAGGDKLATFSNLEEFEKISKYMDSKAAKLINKLFIGGTNLRIPYVIPSLKQYGRFNEGVDSIVRTQAEEMRAYRVIQDKIIRDNKKDGTTMTTKEVRELAWQKLYPISTKDAIAQAVQEFADSGVVPTDAMVKRRAFEIQQQLRDDDVRKLAEKEGLRDTYRTPPKLNADEIEGIFDAINFVFGAITRGFTKPQKGEIGITGKQVAYQAVKANLIPFVNTVMNLLETGSNFVPVYGAAKAALSGVRAGTAKERGGLSQEARREEYLRLFYTQITQNLIGTALSSFLLQMLFDSLNEGLGDDDDEYGIYGSKPYGSKKTNDKTTKVPLRNVVHLPWADIPINAFGVLAPYLYFEAAKSDLKRSIKVSEMNTKSLDEVTGTYLFFNKFPELAGLWLSTMMKNIPLAAPRAFGDMIGKATSGEGSATSRVGEFAGSALKMQFLPQSRALQDAYEAINPTTPEATNFAEGLAKGGGFITQMMFETKPMYDYRGRTIDIKDKHLLTISGFIRRFGDANKSDEIDKFVTKHKLFVNPANSGKETDKYQEAGGSILTHTPYTSEEIYDSYYAINIRFNMALKEGKKKMEEKYKYEDENGKNVKEEYTKYNLEGLENIYNKWYEANKKSGMSEMSAKAYADREVQKAYSEMYNGIEKQYFIEYKEAKVSTPAEYLRLLNVKDPFR